jgi:osmoprotectant transport system ATP-binding protein
LQKELLRLQSVVRKTIVFVTHDIDEAIKLGDRVALLSNGGVLQQYAPPAELLARPASPFVMSFLGEARMVRRLSLIKLRDIALAPVNGAAPATRVDANGTLRDALDAVLRSDDGSAGVLDGERVLGVIDGDIIRKASQ